MSSASVRVLHVDDEPDFADLAGTYLERQDDRLEVETATSAEEGVDRLADTDYDCVVSDYEMPGTDGIEFLERVREAYPDLPFILYTGKGSEEVASEAIRAGVTDYLQKGSGPSQYELLANRIVNAIDQYRAERRAETTEREYRELFRQAPIMYVLVRIENGWPVIKDCNDRFLEKLGYERKSVIGRPATDFYTDDSTAAAFEGGGYERVLAGEFDLEERTLVTKGGEGIDTMLRGSPHLDEHGNTIGIQTLYLDITERKQREQELTRYERIIDASGDAVYTVDAEGHLTFVNDAFCDLVGYPEAELLGEHVSIVMDEEDIDRSEDIIRDLLASDENHETLEMDLIRSGGERVACETHIALLPRGDGGEFVGTTGIHRDITERRERERELEEYHEYTDRLLDAIDDLFFVHDENGDLQRWNEALVETTGYSDEELESMKGAELAGEDDRERATARIQEVFETGHARLEAPLLTKDGTAIPYEYVADRVEHPDGELRLVGIGRDISERKQREEELERDERIIRAMNDGVVVVEDGLITYTNPQVTEMVGHTADELAGEPMGQFIAPEYRETVRNRFRERIAGESPPSTYEIEILSRDGERIPVEITVAQVIRDDHPATVSIVRDISDRRARERQLERQNDRLEEFASVVSHDLRNPLQVADGNVELAREECDSEYLDTVAGALDRMNRLTEDLLTLAREGESVSDPEAVDLANLVDACWETIATADATLALETERVVRADRSRLQQLLENLFGNAVEHGGTDVTVTIGDLADGTGFYVADDGPGIPADERDKVFERGYSTSESGTGFGLAIVGEIATAHGWEVTVTESDAGGARFEITGVETGA